MCTIRAFATHRVIHEIKGNCYRNRNTPRAFRTMRKLISARISKLTRNRVINFNATFTSNKFLFNN